MTVDELAGKLALTANAIRAQLTAMERDGIVRTGGRRPGTTRPFRIFELTPEVEQLLSQAYVPLLMNLVQVFANVLPSRQVNALLREAGKRLAHDLAPAQPPSGDLHARVMFASKLLNEQLGAVTHVEGNGHYVIRGVGCPLAAVTGKHPAVCLAMESLLVEVLGADVRQCCDRTERPKCCFEIRARGKAEHAHRRKRT